MTYPQSEFTSRIQAQADLLAQIVGEVSCGDGTAFADRVAFEWASAKVAVGPAVVISLPSWSSDTFCADGPGELSWRLSVIGVNDDQAVARLWQQALAVSAAVEASPLIQAVCGTVEATVWIPQSGVQNQVPAYTITVNAALP